MSERVPTRPPKPSTHAALPLALALLALLACLAPRAHAQESKVTDGGGEAPTVVEGSLAELRSRRRVLLLITRSLVVDTRDPGQALVREAYNPDARLNRRHRYAFNVIARKLNGYMKKYGGMSAAEEVGEAEYILVFNLLEYKVVLGRAYPYGEMYVVLNQPPDSTRPPRVLWKARKVLWAEDAVAEFIKELKVVRGQK
jgi:hypothetical protein